MTVAELIEKLREMPQDAEVQIDDNDYEQGWGWVSADDVELVENAEVMDGTWEKRVVPRAVRIS